MFKKLYNEAKITYKLKTLSPLYIKSGKKDSLNPIGVENSVLRVYKDGNLVPVLPGTSIKGVFRSRAEKLLKEETGSVCDPLNNNCGNNVEEELDDGIARYKKSCPVCKLFGSTALKSRVLFGDAYPEGDYKIGTRKSVAIDRITGSSTSLFDLEYVEDALFKGEIEILNFFRWHIKVIVQLFDQVNEGFVVFGGLTSKGFGRMELEDFQIRLKYYDKSKCGNDYADKGFYMEKTIKSFVELQNLVENVPLTTDEIGRCEYEEPVL